MANEKKKLHPSVIPHGNKQHRANLGIDQCEDPERKAELEKALIKPIVISKRMPIDRDHYNAQTKRQLGDNIFQGWRRQNR